MQVALRPEPFDSGYFCAVPRHRQNEAGVDPDTIYENRAGAALSVIAALFSSGQLNMFTVQIEERVIHGGIVNSRREPLMVKDAGMPPAANGSTVSLA